MITALLKNYRISPRKFRTMADLVRGKNVDLAKDILNQASKKARHPLIALIDSAIANGKHNHKIEPANLYIKEIQVNQGLVMKRFRPVSRGSAHPFKRRTSHVSLILAERTNSKALTKPKSKNN